MGFTAITSRADFNSALEKTEDGKSLLVIECVTSWCPKCKAIQPAVDELSAEFGGEKGVDWYEVNIDQVEDLSMEYGVNAVPTFMLFKDGDLLPEDKITGAGSDAKRKIREMIEKNLKA